MCSTVIFQYKCGCIEHVVFECPFSSTTSSDTRSSLRALSHQNCSRRYQSHQRKLLLPENATTTATAPSSQQAQLQPLWIEIPTKLVCPKTEKAKGQKASETTITELDESCHDCWQSYVRLVKQKHDSDTASQNSTGNREKEVEHIANTRVLRERAVNELILPPPPPPPIITDSGVTLSTEGFSGNWAREQLGTSLEGRYVE
ncbi:hypothetical protein F4782DRAFT_51726 [Xylaria castorea]|nr:hypothetical protein F4782DRAFT_51726 [Xylaria castorea]